MKDVLKDGRKNPHKKCGRKKLSAEDKKVEVSFFIQRKKVEFFKKEVEKILAVL